MVLLFYVHAKQWISLKIEARSRYGDDHGDEDEDDEDDDDDDDGLVLTIA